MAQKRKLESKLKIKFEKKAKIQNTLDTNGKLPDKSRDYVEKENTIVTSVYYSLLAQMKIYSEKGNKSR